MAIKGLLFDKDGTLFQFEATWAVWCELVLDELSSGDLAKKAELAAAVGYDMKNQRFVIGSLIVNAAAGEINAAWADVLPDMTFEEVDAIALKHVENIPSVPVCPLRPLFEGLKERGFKLGVATNDYEVAAHQQLKEENVDDLFDFVAGFDSGHGNKPDAGPILAFGTATGLDMDQVAMVGDSTHDLGAGRAANVGMKIGVLTGPALAADIEQLADVILADISELPTVLK